MLIGREEELSLIGRLLADVRIGRSRSLVLRGGPGVGKTALLDEALADASDVATLTVTGTEAEAHVPFAALHALLRPLLPDLEAIPQVQARAVRGALALEEADADRLAAYAGTLSLLAVAADRRPVVVVVDDAQFLDRASLEALVFAARRVAGESIGFLFAVRDDEPMLADVGLETHDLGPLPPAAALRLLLDRWGPTLRPVVARRVVAATRGNALALVEVSAALTDAQRAGTEPLDDPLPVTEVVAASVRRRVRALPRTTRQVLLLAAAGAPPTALDLEALEPAEEVGLVQLHAGEARFAHPLIGAAVYRMASPRQRRDAHRRLANVLDEPEDADRRAWHLAAATEGPDDAAADALELAASRAQARGGHSAQAQALARAAELSTDDQARARRLVEAATAAYWSGDSTMAVSLAERALPLARDPLLHAMVVHRLAVIADWHGSWHDRVVPTEVLEREAAAVAPLDARRSVGLLGVILQRHFQSLDTPRALALAERRLALCEPVGDERHLRAIQDLARASGLRGDVARTTELCEQILARVATDGGVIGFATNIAEPLLWLERYGECRSLLVRSVEEARASGNIVRLMFEQTNLALLELRTGAFPHALAAASEVSGLAEETGNDYLLACNLAVLAHLSAARGDLALHEEQAARASAIAARLSDELIAGEVRLARAESALAGGRPAEAAEVLLPLH
ncbi:MAG TPA: AAA family ATPase, partial [Candidatus Limnocylindria bacterium]